MSELIEAIQREMDSCLYPDMRTSSSQTECVMIVIPIHWELRDIIIAVLLMLLLSVWSFSNTDYE